MMLFYESYRQIFTNRIYLFIDIDEIYKVSMKMLGRKSKRFFCIMELKRSR